MAAPTKTALNTPAGNFLYEGFQCQYAFARRPTVSLWEIEVGFPAVRGGDAIDITTQRNTSVRTKFPQSLHDFDNFDITAAFDPNVYNDIINDLLNQNGAISGYFADGSDITFWGYIMDFDPGTHQVGEFPTATFSIVVTNWDDVNNVEAVPVITQVAGT